MNWMTVQDEACVCYVRRLYGLRLTDTADLIADSLCAYGKMYQSFTFEKFFEHSSNFWRGKWHL